MMSRLKSNVFRERGLPNGDVVDKMGFLECPILFGNLEEI